MERDSGKDSRPEVLDAAFEEVEKSMLGEKSLTRNAAAVEQNPTNNMLENLENMVWKIRTIADNLENMLRIIQIMQVVTKMNKKGSIFSMENLINLAGTPPLDIKAENKYDEPDNSEDKGIDAENLLNKMLDENSDMANNPMAKLLLQMLEQKKS